MSDLRLRVLQKVGMDRRIVFDQNTSSTQVKQASSCASSKDCRCGKRPTATGYWPRYLPRCGPLRRAPRSRSSLMIAKNTSGLPPALPHCRWRPASPEAAARSSGCPISGRILLQPAPTAERKAGRTVTLMDVSALRRLSGGATAGAEGRGHPMETTHERERAAEHAREGAQEFAADVKSTAREAAGHVMEETREFVEERKAAGADNVSRLGRAVHGAADQLAKELPQAAGFIHSAAETLQSASSSLRERSVEDMAAGFGDFARRQPAAAFAG